MITYTWTITQMTVKPQDGAYTDMVIVANWMCTGTEGQYAANQIGACQFTQPGDPYTPYSQLTEQQVLGWCWAGGVDKTAIEAINAELIAYFKNPPVENPPLPWSQGA